MGADTWIPTILAIEAEAAEPALDVEVLARALIESDLMPRYLEYARLSPSMNPSETVEHLAATWASFVVREYVRLQSTDPEPPA